MRIRSALAAHPLIYGFVLLLVVGLSAFVLAYFAPQRLFIDDRVHEPLPTVGAPGAEQDSDRDGERAAQRADEHTTEVLAKGDFQAYEHSTSGLARALRLPDGSRYLRLEAFETSNGPDLRVYLSAAPAGGDGDAFDDDYVELGELKGNIGSQNYVIPSDVRLGQYESAVIWCKRFSVAFGAASLS